jgi:hypothetical protein
MGYPSNPVLEVFEYGSWWVMCSTPRKMLITNTDLTTAGSIGGFSFVATGDNEYKASVNQTGSFAAGFIVCGQSSDKVRLFCEIKMINAAYAPIKIYMQPGDESVGSVFVFPDSILNTTPETVTNTTFEQLQDGYVRVSFDYLPPAGSAKAPYVYMYPEGDVGASRDEYYVRNIQVLEGDAQCGRIILTSGVPVTSVDYVYNAGSGVATLASSAVSVRSDGVGIIGSGVSWFVGAI